MSENHRGRLVLPLAGGLLTVLFLLSLAMGSYPLTMRDILHSFRELFAPEPAMATRVFWGLRFPRTITALLSGMTLGLCGGVYQLVFHSPLASPDLTGVASGASFGAALAIVMGVGASSVRMGMAFLFGMAALGMVLLLVQISGGGRIHTYILAGIVISALADAGLMVLKLLADPEKQLAAIDFWTMGSLAAVSSAKAWPMTVIVLPTLVILFICRRPLTMLSLGGEDCRAMGLSDRFWRVFLLSLATLAVSACTAVTGVIGFAGLIAPHIARFLYRRRSGAFLWLCGMIGGILLLGADLAARSLGGGAELPISIFTVAAGVPVLVILLCMRKEGRL